MSSKKEQDAKKCWACKSVLVEDSKLGLCPKYINKYGTPVAAVGSLGLIFAGKQLLKNGGKIVKVAANVVKNIKL